MLIFLFQNRLLYGEIINSLEHTNLTTVIIKPAANWNAVCKCWIISRTLKSATQEVLNSSNEVGPKKKNCRNMDYANSVAKNTSKIVACFEKLNTVFAMCKRITAIFSFCLLLLQVCTQQKPMLLWFNKPA